MVLAKSKKTAGLGNLLMKDRFGKNKGGKGKGKGSGVTRINNATGEEYITNDHEEASYVKLRSVTQQSALDEFLSTAELAGTDFTAEKNNTIKIIHTDQNQNNPFLLSASQMNEARGRHRAHRKKLTVPRRPKWDETTTPAQLDEMERAAFLDWRRGLAQLDEVKDLLMTPFERNIEVWRQLWRVLERSDIIVQIVDARNPLLFRSEDLENYVREVSPKKKNLLLINKADMMSLKQRKLWADYLNEHNISYQFFSAALAEQANEKREDSEEEPDENEDEAADESDREQEVEEEGEPSTQLPSTSTDEEEVEGEDTRILTTEGLEGIFIKLAADRANPEKKLEVGLVGYPNVGKSSTINALIGAKKVSVSATPGKTKHFQTIHLSDQVVLCDCPGLVFPNFAATKAELVCNGVLPIDQMREYTGPAALVAQRFPKPFLEAIYGIVIRTRPKEEGGTGVPNAHELLGSYARARGFWTTGHGTADASRAARLILKDYVNGKLLYCEPPPETVTAEQFNEDHLNIDHVPERRRGTFEKAMAEMSLEAENGGEEAEDMPSTVPSKSKTLDDKFFAASGGNAGHLTRPFNFQYTTQGKEGKHLSGRKARAMIAMETGMDPKDVVLGGKKHYKGGSKGKKKVAKTEDVDY